MGLCCRLTGVVLQMALDISDKGVAEALFKLKDKGEVGWLRTARRGGDGFLARVECAGGETDGFLQKKKDNQLTSSLQESRCRTRRRVHMADIFFDSIWDGFCLALCPRAIRSKSRRRERASQT